MENTTIEKGKIEEIPVLFFYNTGTVKKKVIILLHQLIEDKESEMMLAYYLSVQGYFVLVPDLLYHGESKNSLRESMKFDFNTIYTEMDKSMELIQKLIKFVETDNCFCLDKGDIGIVGTSYGGMLALTAGYYIPKITHIAALCTSANWEVLVNNRSFETFRLFSRQRPVVSKELVEKYILEYDPIYHIEDYKDKFVIMMNGALDTTFNYRIVEPFADKMKAYYESIHYSERYTWKKYARSGHKVTYDMICDLLEWLKLYHDTTER
ncbi:MAG: alpha/beta hydrolase [Lachnospiraceae bacterium]|nr:alpha/beta hydrolase [Lachnospiraceae bacterium]